VLKKGKWGGSGKMIQHWGAGERNLVAERFGENNLFSENKKRPGASSRETIKEKKTATYMEEGTLS